MINYKKYKYNNEFFCKLFCQEIKVTGGKSKMKKNNLALFCILDILIICILSFGIVSGQESTFKSPPAGLLTRAVWLGTLEGTWKEMGFQYGERAAKDIRIGNDVLWGEIVGRFKGDYEKVIQLSEAMEKHLAALSPEMIDFIEGMAEGAANELDASPYANQASNYRRILCQNWELLMRPDYEMFLEEKIANVSNSDDEIGGCSGWWVTGPATKDGETYVSRQSHGGFLDSENANVVVYVLIPNDLRAKVTFVQAAAGSICSGNAFNEDGVYGSIAGAWSNPRTVTGGLGVGDYIAILPAVVYANSAREAADYIIYGTPRYRNLTGRETLLRARGSNMMFADENEAFVVEKGARVYGVRTPGYLGEKGNSYLSFSNHWKFNTGSYDENNVFHSDIPLDQFCPEEEGKDTTYRFWQLMWWFNNNYGNITLDSLMRDLSTAHYTFDKEGKRYDPDPVTGLPISPYGTLCKHDNISEEYPLGNGGSWNISIAVPRTREVYWLPAWPCLFIDHSWNYLNLKLYSDYRNAKYGF